MTIDEVKEVGNAYLMQTYNRVDVSFERGQGAILYDADGREYIDFGSGIGVNSVGHAHARLTQAIALQAKKLVHTSNLYHIPNQALLAQKMVNLCRRQGRGEKEGEMNVFFANSGAEANEAMIKLARKYGEMSFDKKRYKIITLRSSFHGRTIATLKATGQESFHRYFSPFPDGFVIAQDLEDVYQKIDDETCGVMIELIQGEGGIHAWSKDQVQSLALFLQKKQILLLIDEVQSGVYRTGKFLASQLYSIEPDAVSLAKGLGGGIPIGAVMSKHKDIFSPGDHGSTFGGNPLSTRASLEVLSILEEEERSGALQDRIAWFDLELEKLLKGSGIFSKKVGLGLMVGLEAKSLEIQQSFIAKALENGVIVLRSGRNVVRFLPPLTISPDEIKEGFHRLMSVAKALS